MKSNANDFGDARGLIYALGDLSGGHFNPAVTAAVVPLQQVTVFFFRLDCPNFWQNSLGPNLFFHLLAFLA